MKNQMPTRDLLARYYQHHCDELRTYARLRVGRAEVAEDLVQNVFLRLLRHQVIMPVTLPSLVFTTLRNLVCDYWRHRRAVEEYEHLIADARQHGADVIGPESVYSVQEVYALLENGIAHLSAPQQQVYRLHIYDGLKVSEIAETLHIKYKNAEKRLGAARKQVRCYMQQRLAV